MKVLMLSPTPTHPTIAGNRARILALADSLIAAGHTLHFAWVPMEEGDAAVMHAHFGARFIALPYTAPRAVTSVMARLRRRFWRWRGHEQQYLWGIDDWYDLGLSARLAALHKEENFDAVFVEYVFLSRAFAAFPSNVIKVLDTHDRFANRHRQYLQAGKKPEWFSTTEAGERAALLRADVVIAIQEQEARQFSDLLENETKVLHIPRPTITTVGHLVDLSLTVKRSRQPKAVFIASGNSINIDAARYFIDAVLPLIRAQMADFSLLLAGDVCASIADHDGVEKLGRVASIAQTYALGAIAINPVRMGTGLNIKTVECLALGMPLVCSASGSRGLEQWRGQAFLSVADDDPQALADTILALLQDESQSHHYAQSAKQAAREWNDMQLENLDRILQRQSAPPDVTTGNEPVVDKHYASQSTNHVFD